MSKTVFDMNNIMENNENINEEFKAILVKIEPHFIALKSNLEKLLCREWLHKLFKAGKHEESLRNAYLTKLFEQLEKGKLREPFNNLPKHKSPLLPLTDQISPKKTITDFSNKIIYARDKKTIQTAEETSITEVVNVHKTVDVPKSTENHEHTNEIKVNESFNQVKQLDVNKFAHDLKEVQVNEFVLDLKEVQVNEFAHDSKEVQLQKPTIDKSEGGDGLTLNLKTKLKLESVEKVSDELKKKTELLAGQVEELKLYADKNLSNDQIIALNDELNKCKNHLENMRNLEAADELAETKLLENILDQTTVLDKKIVSEMHRVTTIVENACASKKSNNFVMEQLKEKHRLKMDEREHFHTMLNRKLMNEVSQLKGGDNYAYEDEYSST